MQSTLSFYTGRLAIVSKAHENIVRKRQWITLLRFLSFISAAILLVLFIRGNFESYLPAIISFVAFVIVVRIDVNKLRMKVQYVKNEKVCRPIDSICHSFYLSIDVAYGYKLMMIPNKSMLQLLIK